MSLAYETSPRSSVRTYERVNRREGTRVDARLQVSQRASGDLHSVRRSRTSEENDDGGISRSHFIEISQKSEEYLELRLEQLIDILNADELNVKSEEAVFDAMIRWIDYRRDDRQQVGPGDEFLLVDVATLCGF